MKKEAQSSISVLTLLGVLFIGLKLGHVIDWSWWWVTVPFWGGYAFIAALFLIIGLGGLLVMAICGVASLL